MAELLAQAATVREWKLETCIIDTTWKRKEISVELYSGIGKEVPLIFLRYQNIERDFTSSLEQREYLLKAADTIPQVNLIVPIHEYSSDQPYITIDGRRGNLFRHYELAAVLRDILLSSNLAGFSCYDLAPFESWAFASKVNDWSQTVDVDVSQHQLQGSDPKYRDPNGFNKIIDKVITTTTLRGGRAGYQCEAVRKVKTETDLQGNPHSDDYVEYFLTVHLVPGNKLLSSTVDGHNNSFLRQHMAELFEEEHPEEEEPVEVPKTIVDPWEIDIPVLENAISAVH